VQKFMTSVAAGADPADLFDMAFRAGVTARGHVRKPGPHYVQVTAADTERLRQWLVHPNGSSPRVGPPTSRAHFDAVEGGGIAIRTDPYRAVRSKP